MAVLACVRAFILAILCGNPILKGAFVTVANSTIATLDLQIVALTASLARLNFFNQILSFQIAALEAIFSTVRADLNLILEPLNRANSCPPLQKFNQQVQSALGGKKFRAFQKKLYDFNRSTNLANAQSALIQEKDKLKKDLQDMVDEIGTLCP